MQDNVETLQVNTTCQAFFFSIWITYSLSTPQAKEVGIDPEKYRNIVGGEILAGYAEEKRRVFVEEYDGNEVGRMGSPNQVDGPEYQRN